MPPGNPQFCDTSFDTLTTTHTARPIPRIKQDPAINKPSQIKREDHLLVTGRARFAADIDLTHPLCVAFVRSQNAWGKLTEVKTESASLHPNVLAIHTGEDTKDIGDLSVNPVIPVARIPHFPILANGNVLAVGQPIAGILATTAEAALEAAEAVQVEITTTDAPDTIVAEKHWQAGNCEAAFANAAHIVKSDIIHSRLAPSPMEPRTIAVEYDTAKDCATIWHSTQTPHRTRSELAAMLSIDPARLRVIAQHVGGAFGMKGSLYPEEVFVVWASFKHRRSVRWIASRSEEFLSATQGRGIHSKGALAIDCNGYFTAINAEVIAPVGPWLPNSGLIPAWNAARILPSAYCIPSISINTTAKHDGLGPTGIYRGAGRPEANLLMERLIDKAARALNIDPIEIRLRNLVKNEALPWRTATGETLDSGDYARALQGLLDNADYNKRRTEQTHRQAQGELAGLGIAFYLEPSGSGWESAKVTLHADGRVTVASGSSSQGQARETAYAIIASDALGIPTKNIEVLLADTDVTPEGIGALASRSTAIGGSAVLQACNEALTRQRSGDALPLTASVRYENSGQAWGYGAYLAQVSICADTGTLTIEHVSCIDDAGRLIAPQLAHGQIVGGFAQGVGEAVLERMVYDDNGQLLTGSLMDYALPRATDIPDIDVHTFETPSPTNLLGAKGLGEAGTIGAPAAILNAAIDALSPLGITDLQMPLTSYTLWQAIQRSTAAS